LRIIRAVSWTSLKEAELSSGVFPGFQLGLRGPLSVTGVPVVFEGVQASTLSGLIAVLSRVRSQRSFEFSDCTPKHLFVDPAPACEESPDPFGRHVNIRYSTALRDMARLNQTDVVAVEQLNRLSNSD
jgi:hypothetical protein